MPYSAFVKRFLLLFYLNMVDWLTTSVLLAHNKVYELNPIGRWVWEASGALGLLVLKLFVMLAIFVTGWLVYHTKLISPAKREACIKSFNFAVMWGIALVAVALQIMFFELVYVYTHYCG